MPVVMRPPLSPYPLRYGDKGRGGFSKLSIARTLRRGSSFPLLTCIFFRGCAKLRSDAVLSMGCARGFSGFGPDGVGLWASCLDAPTADLYACADAARQGPS